MLAQNEAEIVLQLLLLQMLAATHVEVQHRIFSPVLFYLFDGESLKEFLLAGEIALKG